MPNQWGAQVIDWKRRTSAANLLCRNWRNTLDTEFPKAYRKPECSDEWSRDKWPRGEQALVALISLVRSSCQLLHAIGISVCAERVLLTSLPARQRPMQARIA